MAEPEPDTHPWLVKVNDTRIVVVDYLCFGKTAEEAQEAYEAGRREYQCEREVTTLDCEIIGVFPYDD